MKDENYAPIEGASMKIRGRDVGFQTTKVRTKSLLLKGIVSRLMILHVLKLTSEVITLKMLN